MYRSLGFRPFLRISHPSIKPSKISVLNTVSKFPQNLQVAQSKPSLLSQSVLHHISFKRQFSTTSSLQFARPPRFNARPPSTFSLVWHLIPDPLKLLLGIMGTVSFIMFIAAPVILIVLPPLFLGGYFASRYWLRKRSSDMEGRWDNLLKTHLTYEGSELDQIRLQDFTLERLVDAFETNEQGITDFFDGGRSENSQHHSYSSRFKLTGIETIDQDFRVSKLGIQESISVMSFGLTDKDSRIGRIATVVLTLRPKRVTNLLELNSLSQDAVIEIKPIFNALGKSFILNTGSDSSRDSPDKIINIKAHNTKRYK